MASFGFDLCNDDLINVVSHSFGAQLFKHVGAFVDNFVNIFDSGKLNSFLDVHLYESFYLVFQDVLAPWYMAEVSSDVRVGTFGQKMLDIINDSRDLLLFTMFFMFPLINDAVRPRTRGSFPSMQLLQNGATLSRIICAIGEFPRAL
jgi:hypothetical protein